MTSPEPPTEDRLPEDSTEDRVATGDTGVSGHDGTVDDGPAHDGTVHDGTVHDGSGLPADRSHEPPYTHTRLSGYWAAIVVGLLVLLVLIIFILENTKKVEVSFFGAHAHLSLGIALLLAAVIGGLVVVFAGTARILQLRTRARRTARAADGPRRRRRRK